MRLSRRWTLRARYESARLSGHPLFLLSSNATQGLLKALRLFVVFYSSLHACSHCLGYVSKVLLRLRIPIAHGYIGGLDSTMLLISRYSSTSFFRRILGLVSRGLPREAGVKD